MSAALDRDMHWQLRFVQTVRQVGYEPSKGSGYSTLFAKFMACGSIPFGRGNSRIKAVCIHDGKALKKFKKGANFVDSDRSTPLPGALDYLNRISSTDMIWPHFQLEPDSEFCPRETELEGHGLIKMLTMNKQ